MVSVTDRAELVVFRGWLPKSKLVGDKFTTGPPVVTVKTEVLTAEPAGVVT